MVSSIKALIGKLFNSKPKKWEDIEYFHESWKVRIELMSKLLKDDCKSVVDFGCGRMWLKEYLKSDTKYLGVDYAYRGEGAIVCDLNKKQFPEGHFDSAFVSGCLEYIEDTEWFVESVSRNFNECVISYCVTDFFSNLEERKKLTWVNNLSEMDLIDLFRRNNMILEYSTKTETENRIYKFVHG